DEAVIALESFTTASMSLSQIISAIEALDPNGVSMESMDYHRAAVTSALRPIGMFYSDLGISMEDDKPGVVQRFKALLIRLYKAVTRTAAKIWGILKKAFGSMYSKHRELRKEIDDTRVALSKLSGAIHKTPTVSVSSDYSIIGSSASVKGTLEMPKNYAD